MSKIVVALGGNALQMPGDDGSAAQQYARIEESVKSFISLVKDGHELAISHGNGPQVGRVLLQNENSREITPAMPLDVCGASTQGMIGYQLQNAILNQLRALGIEKTVATIVTQAEVKADDPAFASPSKPVGPFMSEAEAKAAAAEKGYAVMEDAGRGWRRVVPSPQPIAIVENEAIKTLLDAGVIVISGGGGGIPVVRNQEGNYEGIEAVIDKDFATQVLADNIDADIFCVLTGVKNVCLNYGKPNEVQLGTVSVAELEAYIEEGHFAKGSMLPKVEAALRFVRKAENRKAIITDEEHLAAALNGQAGTIIMR
ncbi:MAG: carbamate kinase [Eubacteriales bacterium]|nr:carbamate kinase [Eubacteriales bacterium]